MMRILLALLLTGCGGGGYIGSCELNRAAMLDRMAALRGSAIQWSPVLAQAAQVHAQDLAVSDVPSHTGSDGTQPVDRAVRAGWPSRYVGENLTAGQVDQAGAMESWENSPGHRANLVNRKFTHMGAACVESSSRVYWVQVLAS